MLQLKNIFRRRRPAANQADDSYKTLEKDDVTYALNKGIARFFTESRSCIEPFIRAHYRYPGCWQSNRRAFGFDLGRAPLNLIWAPFYVIAIIFLTLLGLLGLKKASIAAQRLPSGMNTNVQRHLNTAMRAKLLNSDRLRDVMVDELETLAEIEHLSKSDEIETQLEVIVDGALEQLMLTRTASADITNTLFSTALGAFAFNKFTPGGIGIGIFAAAYWVKVEAEKNFFLGQTAGSWYYTLFPPQPDLWQQAFGVVIVMLVLAVFASFSGLITDPLQARLGIHRWRLNRMLAQIEKDLLARTHSKFKPLDPYVARILELFDTLKVGM